MMAALIPIPQSIKYLFPYVSILNNICDIFVFLVITILISVMQQSIVVLSCICLIIVILYFYHVICGHFYVFFREMDVQILLKKILLILDIKLLVWFSNILSHSVDSVNCCLCWAKLFSFVCIYLHHWYLEVILKNHFWTNVMEASRLLPWSESLWFYLTFLIL